MTKLRNKIVLVLLVLCLAVCAGLFVACGDDAPKDKSVTYTVTVMAGDTAAEGVQVTVKKGSAILGTPKTTGSDGKAEFKLAEDAGYTVTLADLPRGYKLADDAELKFDGRKLTVTLEEKPVSYTIKLVNPDNTSYTTAGVLVGICTVESNNCLALVAPDASGTVKIYDAEKTDYHIQIKGLPEGYAFESDGTYAIRKNNDGQYRESNGSEMVPVYVELTDTVVEQKIMIYPVNVIKLTDDKKLSAEELDGDYADVEGMSAYKMNIEVEANSTVYYEYTADYSGAYNFYSDNGDLVCKLNESFLLGDSYLSGTGMFISPITMEKGKKYYLNVTNYGEEKATAEAILATPYATYSTVTGAGTAKVEINKQGKCAVIELEPTAGSTYKLTVNGNGAVKQATSSYAAENLEFEDADYTNSKELIVKYTEDMEGMSLYFAVSTKGNVPASVEVKIEKIGTHTNQTVVVQAANLTQTADNDDENKELIPVALNATVVKGDDGKYHLGNATGPIVYVNLTGDMSVSRYPHNLYPLVEMEMAAMGNNTFILDATTQADIDNPNKGKTFKDFRTALRGFDKYKYGPSGMTPSEKTTENYYAKYVNGDGLYPLDDTLKELLELAAPDPLLDTEWLFACYYYGDIVAPDAIVGEYETEDRQYTLTVEKFGGFYIQERGEYNYYEYGTWTKSGEAYTFVCKDAYDLGTELTYADGSFTYDDGWDKLIFTVADPIVGVYSDVNGDFLYLNRDGTCAWGEDAGSWNKNADNDYYTITLYVDCGEGNPGIYKYTAVYNESLGIVKLYTWEGETAPDVTNPDLNVDYEFAAVNNNDDEVDITGEYECATSMGKTTLTVNADFSFVFDYNNGYSDSGSWKDVGGSYEFTVVYEGDEDGYTYTVYFEDGELVFYSPDPEVFEPEYTFAPVGEEEGEPDRTLISTNQGAVLKLYYSDESGNAGTFKYYRKNPMEDVKLCEGTFEMGPDGLTAIVTNKAGEVAGASATMNEKGQIVVSIRFEGMEEAGTQTFDLTPEEEAPDTQD